jgi:hypothetical protein
MVVAGSQMIVIQDSDPRRKVEMRLKNGGKGVP